MITILCMSQEWPDTLVGGLFGRHISYYARIENIEIFITPLLAWWWSQGWPKHLVIELVALNCVNYNINCCVWRKYIYTNYNCLCLHYTTCPLKSLKFCNQNLYVCIIKAGKVSEVPSSNTAETVFRIYIYITCV